MRKTSDRDNDRVGQSRSVGLIIRQKEPKNLETPMDRVDSFLTPTELFCIRSHFPTPWLDLASYRLAIDGAVQHPLSLSYEELRRMPSETRVATLECAGNSRVFLVPQADGAQWELGAVGNAEWTGVPLADLLERAGLREDACEVVLEGADRGTPKEPPIPPEHRRRRNLGSGGVHRPRATACLATLETRLAYTRETGTIHPSGPRQRRQRLRSA